MADKVENEWEIIERSKYDLQYFEPLYTKYYPKILSFVYKRVDCIDDAYELSTETFGKAMLNIKKYKDKGFPFSSWLYRIALNEIALFYRAKSKMRCINIDSVSITNVASETETDQQELKVILKAALQYVDEKDLIVLELRFFEERPFSEISEILDITESNAKIRTYRALDKLKIIFQKLSK